MDRQLYDQDFYLWTQSQAAALEAEGARSRSNALDWELLAEEVRDLGGSQLRECLSRTITILEHLYKLAWTAREEPQAGWRETVRTQRRELRLALTASIERLVEARLEELHLAAAADAAESFAEHEPGVAPDLGLRWSMDQLMGAVDDPLKQ
jgi:hypothetical protein